MDRVRNEEVRRRAGLERALERFKILIILMFKMTVCLMLTLIIIMTFNCRNVLM